MTAPGEIVAERLAGSGGGELGRVLEAVAGQVLRPGSESSGAGAVAVALGELERFEGAAADRVRRAVQSLGVDGESGSNAFGVLLVAVAALRETPLPHPGAAALFRH